MARVTYVKKAQQRYATVPVLNEDGTPKQTPVMRRDGTQKVTKKGRPVFLSVTKADKTKPLPLLVCDHCHDPIQIGTPYKHVTPKSGPYGGRQRNRHAACPPWKIWELSNSWSARIAQVTDEVDFSDCETIEDFESRMGEVAEEIRGLASESEEAADNIEDGFGHETYQSQEARERAEMLESWADDIEGTEIPEFPEPEADTCEHCDGLGEVTPDLSEDEDPESDEVPEAKPCEHCDGTGEVTPEEPTEDQIAEWQSEAADACQSALQDCPV